MVFALAALLAGSLGGQISDGDAVRAAQDFAKAVKLSAPAGKPEVRRIAGMTTVGWDGYDFTYYPGAKWPSAFGNGIRLHEIVAGQHRTHHYRFANSAAAEKYAKGFAAALHVPAGAVVSSFMFGTPQGDISITWSDVPPLVVGKRLKGLNQARANFDMQDGVLKEYSGGWHVKYAKPLVKLTAAQAVTAALRAKPAGFRPGPFHAAGKPTKTELVWVVPRLSASGSMTPYNWEGTARVAYRVTFGVDYLDVDAETGKLLTVEMFK